MQHNTERLTTKPDLRRTLEWLSKVKNGGTLKESTNGAISLFTEKVPDGRTCKDIKIPN